MWTDCWIKCGIFHWTTDTESEIIDLLHNSYSSGRHIDRLLQRSPHAVNCYISRLYARRRRLILVSRVCFHHSENVASNGKSLCSAIIAQDQAHLELPSLCGHNVEKSEARQQLSVGENGGPPTVTSTAKSGKIRVGSCETAVGWRVVPLDLQWRDKVPFERSWC